MNSDRNAPIDNRDLIFLVLLLALGITVFQLMMSGTGHEIGRDQHLATAVEYARGHIDLMKPVIVGFNANGTATPLEFPIWQAITAVLMKGFGLWHGWGNVTSLFFLLTSMWPIYDLARRLFSERVAWWTLFFSLMQPLNIIVGGQAGADSTCWAFAVWFVYFAYRMMNSGSWLWWAAAVVAGCLSATTKAPFFMVAGLTGFFWLLKGHRHSRLAWLQLVSAGTVSCLVFYAWNLHAQKLYDLAVLPVINLSILKGSQIKSWYFGDLAFRLHPANWIKGVWHGSVYLTGNLGLVVLLLVGLRLGHAKAAWLWLAAAGASTLVFTPLILGHDHYFFIFSPAVALICASAAKECEPAIWERLRAGAGYRFVILFLLLVFSLAECLEVMHYNMFFDRYKDEVGQLIKQHTSPDDKLVVWGAIWSEPFLRAERQGLTGGLSLDANAWFNDPKNRARLKELGYNKLVMMNPSPFVVALTSVNSKHGEAIVDLAEHLPPAARDWPVAFRSPEILIVNIP